MKQIVLVRHAKSSWADPSLADYDRPLNWRGQRDLPFMATAVAQQLKALQAIPQLILSSPANRTTVTANAFAAALGYPAAAIVYNARLYEADGATLLRIVQNLDDTQPHIKKLMLVGHNPGLTHLAYLLTALSVTDNLPTCATLGVQIPIDTWRALPQTQNTSVFIYDYPKRYPNLQNEPKSTEL